MHMKVSMVKKTGQGKGSFLGKLTHLQGRLLIGE